MAVLLGAAPLSHAQIYFSNGVVPFYGARFSYAAPYLGAPIYGAGPYGTYGYGYGTYGYGYGLYGYGGGLPGYRFGVLPRHAGLLRTLWIFAPPTTTTTKTPSPTTVDGSTIKVNAVADRAEAEWRTRIKEATDWKYDLLGQARPVLKVATVEIVYNSKKDEAVNKILRTRDLDNFCKGLGCNFKPVDDPSNASPLLRFKAQDGTETSSVDLPTGLDAIQAAITKGASGK
jgi:hypothetical protein